MTLSIGHRFNFNYHYLVDRKPPIVPNEEVLTRNCRRCGAEFQTRGRAKHRCDACQEVAAKARLQKANERLKQKRKAATRRRFL